VKHITTGDGGMFITKHQDLAEKVHKARGFGVDRTFSERSIPGMYDVPTLGLNYRMSDINAAIGRVQLRRVGEILELRARNFARLKAGIAGLPNVRVIDATRESTRGTHYCLSVVLTGALADRRTDVIGRMSAAGAGTSVYYPQPVPRMTYYREKYGYDEAAYPNATEISDRSIALPVGPHLSEDDVDYVAAAFAQAIKELS
jgi:perosamine synthetase